MSFNLRIEGFGKIETYEVNPKDTVKEVKDRFCHATNLPIQNVVPFVNTRLLIEAHTLEEAHVNEETTIKMYDREMAKMIIIEEASEPKMRIESYSNTVNLVGLTTDFNNPKPAMGAGLRAWNSDGKPKGILGLF